MSYDWPPKPDRIYCPSCENFLSEPEGCETCGDPVKLAIAWQRQAARDSSYERMYRERIRAHGLVLLQELACLAYARARRAYEQFVAPLECELCGCQGDVCECLPADRAGLAAVAADLERRAKANVGSTRGEIQSRLADRARRAYDQFVEGRP